MNWNTLIYQIPREPQKHRIAVWRKLKSMGSVNVLQSIWVMPNEENYKNDLNKLAQRIKDNGGKAFTSIMTIEDPEEDSSIINIFNKEREEEYKELLGKCRDFIEEIKKESNENNFSFTELDENEQEIEKLENWFFKIKKKDFFSCTLQLVTEENIKNCKDILQEFSNHVYKKEVLIEK